MTKQLPWKSDEILRSIVDELQITYHCHTIILYGSRARGDFTSTSDYDVAGITSSNDKKWIARFDENHQVFYDIFIFPEKELINPTEDHLQMADGVVIIDHNHVGKHLLEKLKNIQSKPLSISNEEIKARKVWYKKMLARANVSDIEGKYRHIWAIHAILEDYFSFKKLRFQGPKKAFQYLKEYDPAILCAFEVALSNPNDLDALKHLIEAIAENKTPASIPTKKIPINIREAYATDINVMVNLSKQKRLNYEKAQPKFWKYAPDAEQQQNKWFHSLLNEKNHLLLIAEVNKHITGFIIGRLKEAPEVYRPGGLTLEIDDFCVESSNQWEEVGPALMQQLKLQAKARGAVQFIVVCGAHDIAKSEFLKNNHAIIASEWYVGDIL